MHLLKQNFLTTLPLKNSESVKKLFKVCFLSKLDHLLFSLSLFDRYDQR